LMENAIAHNCSASDGQLTLAMANSLCTSEIADLGSNHNTVVIVTHTILVLLATISVILRIYCRRKTGLKLWWDDYFILLGLLFTYGVTIDVFVGLSVGFGHHIITLGYYEIINFGKMYWAGQLIFVVALTTIKISILFFYLRIFPGGRFRSAVICVGALQIAWCISVFAAVLFSCTPVKYFWDKNGPYGNGHCINITAMLYAATSTGFLADVSVWCLPIAPLWALQMQLSRKIVIIAIFLLGGLVCISAAIRLPFIYKLNEVDLTWSCEDIGIWIVVESNLGIVCACIPILGPCLKGHSASSTILRIFGIFSMNSRKPSESSTSYESKPVVPLSITSNSNHDEIKDYQSVDVNGSVERIIRLGHVWELDDRVALNQVKPHGVVS